MAELLEELATEGEITVRGERVRVGGGDVVFEGRAAAERDRIDTLYRTAALTVPDRRDVIEESADADLAVEVLAALHEQGGLVKLSEEIFCHREAWERALAEVRAIHAEDGAITVGAVRDRLSISRKYAVPLLETMDAKRITRRDGDVRALLKTGEELE
jgi:selenocysteine-specific elongation factor